MKVLLVDDSEAIRITLSALFEEHGHEPVEAESLAAARAHLYAGAFDAAIIDLTLEEGLGTELIGELRRASPDAAIVLHSGHDVDPAVDGADLVVRKGESSEELILSVERLLAARRGRDRR